LCFNSRNGIGKTSVLILIYESLNNKNDYFSELEDFSKYCSIKYFNSAEGRISNDSIELEDLNKKISIFFKESFNPYNDFLILF